MQSLQKNESIPKQGGTCTAPPVKLHVRPEDEKHVCTKPYPIPLKLREAVLATIKRWLDEIKIALR